jgi:hypothetical protein
VTPTTVARKLVVILCDAVLCGAVKSGNFKSTQQNRHKAVEDIQ